MPELPIASNPAPAAGVTPPAPEGEVKPGAAQEETYTVKVNGEERKMTRAQLIERAQKGEGAEIAMKQAAEVNKAFNNFVAQAQDPEKLLALLQHPSLKYDEEKQEVLVNKIMAAKNPRVINAVKKWIYDNEIAPKLMDPKERELAEKNARLAAYEKQEAERKANEEMTQKQLAAQKKFNEHRLAIGTSIKAEGLPETEGTVVRVARYAKLQIQAKKPLDFAECAKRVKADLIKEYEDRFSAAEDDKILDMLPEKVAERIHKAYLKRLKGADPLPPAGKAPDANEPSLDEMLKKVNRGGVVFKD